MSDPELMKSDLTDEEFFMYCLDNAYKIARSMIILREHEFETAIVAGVSAGASGLTLDDKHRVNKELLARLCGRSVEELGIECDEEEKERAERRGRSSFYYLPDDRFEN